MSRPKIAGSSILMLDTLISVSASLLAILLVRWVSSPTPGFTTMVLRWLGLVAVVSLLAFIVTGSYKVVRRWVTLNSSMKLLWSVAIKEMALAIGLLAGIIHLPSVQLYALLLLADTMLTSAMLVLIRFAARAFSMEEVSRIKSQASRMNALVAGTDTDSVQLAASLESKYNVLGFITSDPSMSGKVIRDIVVYCCRNQEELNELEWRLGGVDAVFFPKHMINFTPGGKRESTPALADMSGKMGLLQEAVKRGFDIVLSAALLLVFSPLSAICALAVKLEDGGPVLFRQERIGKNGKPFEILKFRSMRVDAEADGARLYSGEKDPRLTRVGAFLRAHHLDELPQLWNVFRGDMSFIGYRPERQCFIDQITQRNPRYNYLYQIRPGVTSYATLYNGYTDTLEKMLIRLDLDLYYLRNRSILFDLRVLGLTFLGIISGKKF